MRVLLLESGGIGAQAEADALSEIENVGAPRIIDQSVVRPRVLGGTSGIWTGRCAPFDEIDFEPRSWVPHSGWPVGLGELTPFLDRSAGHLGLGAGSGFTEAGPPSRSKPAPRHPEIDPCILRPFFWQFSRDAVKRADSMRFGPRLLAEKADNVRVITNASVTHINTNATASSVESVEVAGLNGEHRTVTAPMVVLCAGGIENARLLLASNRVAPAGLGNGHDIVGRFLMDHPRGGVARFDHTRAAALNPYLRMQLTRIGGGTYLFCKGLRLSPEIQEREGLLNCAVWLSEIVMDDDPWSALKRMLRRQGRLGQDSRAIISNPGLLAQGMRGVLTGDVIPRKLEGLELNCTVEQRPDPDSRVTLSDRMDRNGTPLSRVHWRVNEHEQHTVRRTAELVVQELARLEVAAPV
ncbi:MAG: GMC family oxidoreductase N-terminal domain-containing protein, partial [Pseudomonadota bacterium]|nr:GMC family oxidoreductase N-terminal domain-containing protein [Pseudomonadota bacterium]